MNNELMVTQGPEDAGFNRRLYLFRRNAEWLTEHGAPFFERYAGQYIAVSEGEVFASHEVSDARRLASEKHPQDEPFVQYIPKDSYARIYAN